MADTPHISPNSSPIREEFGHSGEALREALHAAAARVADWAEQNSIQAGSSGYMGHVDSGVAVAGVLGDFLASAFNQNLLAYESAPRCWCAASRTWSPPTGPPTWDRFSDHGQALSVSRATGGWR